MSDGGPPTHGLLDTNTVILLARLRDPQQLPPVPAIATASLAELSVGPLVATTETERAARQAHLQQAEADFAPIPIDAASARAFGQVAADLRRSGRKTSAPAYDADRRHRNRERVAAVHGQPGRLPRNRWPQGRCSGAPGCTTTPLTRLDSAIRFGKLSV